MLEALEKFRKWLPFTFDIDINTDFSRFDKRIKELEMDVHILKAQIKNLMNQSE